MTFRRSLLRIFYIFIFVFLVLFVLRTEYSQRIGDKVIERIRTEISVRTGLDIKIDSISHSKFSAVSVSGVAVSSNGSQIFSIPEISVTPGISAVVKMIAKGGTIPVNITVPEIRITAGDEILKLAAGLANNKNEAETKQNKLINDLKNRLKLNIFLDEMSTDVSIDGMKIKSDKIRLSCIIDNNGPHSISIKSSIIGFEGPQISASAHGLNCNVSFFKTNRADINVSLSSLSLLIDKYSCALNRCIIHTGIEPESDSEITVSSGFFIHTQLPGLESVESDLFASVLIPHSFDLSLSESRISLSQIKSSIIHDDSFVNILLHGTDNAEAEVSFNSQMKTNLKYCMSNGHLEAESKLNNLMIHELQGLLAPGKSFLKSFANELSCINGTMSANLDLKNAIIPDGEVLCDMNFSDFVYKNKYIDASVDLRAQLSENILSLRNFTVSAEGFNAVCSGEYDIFHRKPNGHLSIFRTNKHELIGELSFLPSNNSSSSYQFNIDVPSKPDLKIEGEMENVSDKNIVARTVVSNTKSEYGFTLEVDYSDGIKGKYFSKGLEFYGGLGENSSIYLNGNITNLAVKMKNGGDFTVSTQINALYILSKGSINVKLKEMNIDISDRLSASFNAEIENTKVAIHDMRLIFGNEVFDMNGEMTVESQNMRKILERDFSEVDSEIHFTGTEGSFITGRIHDSVYSLHSFIGTNTPVSISLLGSEGSGFIGDVSVGVFSFQVIYRNGVFSIAQGNGRYGNMEISSFMADINFKEKSFTSSFIFSLITDRYYGTVSRSCNINAYASLSSFSIKSASIKDIDYSLNFNVDISEFKLSDDFAIPDTTLRMVFHKGILTIAGSVFDGFADLNSKMISLKMSETNGLGFNIKGQYYPSFDLVIHNISIPSTIANTFMKTPVFKILEGSLNGDLIITGNQKSPEIYGMLYCPVFKCSVFYLPDQVLTVNNMAITANGKQIYMPNTPLIIYNEADMTFSYGEVGTEIVIQNLSPEYIDIGINLDNNSRLNMWIPAKLKTEKQMDLNVKGCASGGTVGLRFMPGKPMYLSVDTEVSDLTADFKLPQMPDFFNYLDESIDMSLNLTTGANVQFFYPSIDNSFINFTLLEDEHVSLTSISSTRSFKTNGSLSFKTGRIFYFNNDFYITDGKIDFSPNPLTSGSSGLDLLLDLTAKISMYDVKGKPIDISLILNNATLNNFTPHFISTPSKTENEILQILGNAILPSETEGLSLSYVASIAAMASQTISKLGLIESNREGLNLSSSVKNTLGLDILSFRSSLITNMIVNALPGKDSSKNVSLIARYLDGTSMFAGKNFTPTLFGKLWIQLNADKKGNRTKNAGHFLTEDLVLNLNMSLDWKNPMFTFTFFTQPKELSVFSFLDNIGFSVTKSIRF